MLYIVLVVSIGVAFMLGTFYGRKLGAKAEALRYAELAKWRADIDKAKSLLKHEMGKL